jgi:L-fucose mutarotase
VERFDFYEEAKRCQFVVATGETRSYGCFLLTKGILSGSAIAGV